MKELEKILRALGNRRRLAILKYLKHEEAFVSEIAREINLSYRSTSRHLATLHNVDIVQREQRGHEMFYSLSSTQTPAAKFILSQL